MVLGFCALGVRFEFSVVWVWVLLIVLIAFVGLLWITLRLRLGFIDLNFRGYIWVFNLTG